MSEIEQQNESTDVDALVSAAESSESHPEIPMGDEPARSQQETQPAASTPQTIQELEFTWNGKPVKVPLNDQRLKQWAAQGYDYGQKMSEFTQAKTQWEAQRAQHDAKVKPYLEIDEYASKNPQWWQKVQEIWKAREQALDPSNPLAKELGQLKTETGEMRQYILQQKQKEAAIEQESEDKALESQIESVRKTYPDLDLSAKDPSDGKTLEYKVLEYAHQNGLRSFDQAFKLFNHDRLVKIAEEKAKENLVKEKQKQTKLGLLGQSSTPRKGLQPADGIKNKSYDQLMKEGAEELGIAL